MSENIILGVSGSIAAPKAQSIVGALQHNGFDVRIAMTYSATQIVSPVALSAVCPTAPFTSMWQQQGSVGGEIHIEWAQWADAILIAPATASLISALTHGVYDNCVSLLAANIPESRWYIAPGMSQEMWSRRAVQENAAKLRSWGVSFLGPVPGKVASGAQGQRLMEPREIASELRLVFDRRPVLD
jgi:phosphopantothenoylcysteine decarboxylase/phosphopantothenate--cysteine ligase